jgi:hypothetical protein
MKAIYFLLSLLLYFQDLVAQDVTAPKDFVAPSRYWGISITPTLITKAIVTGEKEDYQIKNAPQFGAEVLIHYHYQFEQQYAVILGGGFNISGYNFKYNIPKNMFDPPAGANITTNGAAARQMNIIYFRVPIELERTFLKKKDNKWALRAGGSILFSVQQPEETSDAILYPTGGSQIFFKKYQDNNNSGKPWFSFHLITAHTWVFKKNAMQVGLKLNYCPIKFVNGEYHFNVGAQAERQGRYGLTGSYIGLSFEYIFSKPAVKL